MEETMETYVLESSETLNNNFENKAALLKEITKAYIESGKENICIVASGSSYNSALCALPYMNKISGVNVELLSPYTFTNYKKIKENTFYMVISQGGESINSIEAMEYLKKIRISHATNMLSTTDKSISFIAQECGFFDSSHFTHVFEQSMNMKPKQFRQRSHLDSSD